MNRPDIEQDTTISESPEVAGLLERSWGKLKLRSARMLARAALRVAQTVDGDGQLARLLVGPLGNDGEAGDIKRDLGGDRVGKSMELHRSIMESMNDVVFSLGLDGNILYISQTIGEISKHNNDELTGSPFNTFIHPDDLSDLVSKKNEILTGKGEPIVVRIIDKEENIHWMRITTTEIYNNERRPCGVTGVMIDVTEQVNLVDSMTGLYGSNHLKEELNRLEHSRRVPFSFIYVDLDELKFINDNYGHDVGDQKIIATAAVLKDSFREEDCVARAGGDEFVIVLPETDAESARKSVARIRDGIKRYNIENPNFPLSISIGTTTTDDVMGFREAFINSDRQMNDEKKKKKEDARLKQHTTKTDDRDISSFD